ncbi:uncharacterized protein LOC128964394 [Oppia nitens]|uniref:uncharacterized protein LOC128964394 n=1 Tax=Oppia nitens TaxID=1686743 RepID=UPI0023D9BBE5|nr:uncharacterized protein LOC128964394 [Oppia nitens]
MVRSIHRSTHSLSHYSASLSRYAPRSTEFNVIKYTLLVFMILQLFNSIWICIFITSQSWWELNAARDDLEKISAVNTWYIVSLTFVILADCVDLFLMFGIWMDRRDWTIATCLLSLLFAIYGISSVYTRGSITCFVIPFVIFTLSAMFLWMIRNEQEMYDVSTPGSGYRTATTAIKTGY